MSEQTLATRHCEACSRDAPQATEEEKSELMPEVHNWRLHEVDGEERLTRSFDFKNFADALAFTNRIGTLAEDENHHPALLTEWGSVTVSWWTHKIGGLHRNDFIMAAKTDALYSG